jgi:hypothetical protein
VAKTASAAYTAAKKLLAFANSQLGDLGDLVQKQREIELAKWRDE